MTINEQTLKEGLGALLRENPKLMQVLKRDHIERCMANSDVMKYYAAVCTMITGGVVPPINCDSVAVRVALQNSTFLLLLGSYLMYRYHVSSALVVELVKKHLPCANFREAISAAFHAWAALMHIQYKL